MSHISTYRFPFSKYPAVRIALLMMTGIVIVQSAGLKSEKGYVLILFTVIASLYVLFEWLSGRTFSANRKTAVTFIYLMMTMAFGASVYTLEQAKIRENIDRAEPLQLYEWETVTIEGEIERRGQSSSGRNVYEVEVSKTLLPEKLEWHHKYKVRLYGKQGGSFFSTTQQDLTAEIRLYGFPEKRNPHEFDYGKWLISKGIVAHGEIEKVKSASDASRINWILLRQHVLSSIEKLFGEKRAPLAKALFTGYKEELTPELKTRFSRAGLSHIMAVSGMHVGFVVAPFWLLIPWLWRLRYGKITGLILLTTLLFLYAGLTGFSASVSRASIMAWLLTYGKLYHKIRHSVNLLATAAIVMLVWRPSDLFNIGFQLSFSAVLVILLVMPESQKVVPERIRFDWRGSLATIVLISVIVQAGLFPVLAHYFGEFSVIGPVANALVVPLLAVVVPVGLFCSIIGIYVPAAAGYPAGLIEWGIQWIEIVAGRLGGADQSFITVPELSPWIFGVWIFAVLVVGSISLKMIRWKMGILLLISLNFFVADQFYLGDTHKELRVTVLDAGQGDAIHIRTPNGKQVLVDAGRWSPGGDSGEDLILPYLKHTGAEKLDAVILSHPHADHIGGIRSLIGGIDIEMIYQSSYSYDSKLYNGFIEDAKRAQVPITQVSAGDILSVDPAIRLFVLGPERPGKILSNPNNNSVVIRMDYGKTSFLFTGDAEREQEQIVRKRYRDMLNTDILKVGHHGSKTSSSKAFLDKVQPQVTVASLAFNNRFSHPGREAVTRLNRTGAKNYFTSLSGALIFRSNGEKVKTETILDF
ncbi:MAG: DNA internalization-related competence protein ComEC/Rec2 [Balneolaceae bacterium]